MCVEGLGVPAGDTASTVLAGSRKHEKYGAAQGGLGRTRVPRERHLAAALQSSGVPYGGKGLMRGCPPPRL